jgi:hypothetical protein
MPPAAPDEPMNTSAVFEGPDVPGNSPLPKQKAVEARSLHVEETHDWEEATLSADNLLFTPGWAPRILRRGRARAPPVGGPRGWEIFLHRRLQQRAEAAAKAKAAAEETRRAEEAAAAELARRAEEQAAAQKQRSKRAGRVAANTAAARRRTETKRKEIAALKAGLANMKMMHKKVRRDDEGRPGSALAEEGAEVGGPAAADYRTSAHASGQKVQARNQAALHEIERLAPPPSPAGAVLGGGAGELTKLRAQGLTGGATGGAGSAPAAAPLDLLAIVCPVCRHDRIRGAAVDVDGSLACWTCLLAHVAASGLSLAGQPMGVADIRRLRGGSAGRGQAAGPCTATVSHASDAPVVAGGVGGGGGDHGTAMADEGSDAAASEEEDPLSPYHHPGPVRRDSIELLRRATERQDSVDPPLELPPCELYLNESVINLGMLPDSFSSSVVAEAAVGATDH